MKTFWYFRKARSSVLMLVIGMTLINVHATIITLDFEGIPDGTPVAANNPYAGVVNLQGQADYRFSSAAPPYDYIHIFTGDGVIDSGLVRMGVSDRPPVPPGTITGPLSARTTTTLTATFLEPVRGLTFETYVPQYFVFYDYTGVDKNGDPIHGVGRSIWGIMDPETWAFTTILDAPEGGYFTKLELSNWDYGGSADFNLNYLTLRGVGVPEPSTLPDKAFLLFLLAVAPFVGRKCG